MKKLRECIKGAVMQNTKFHIWAMGHTVRFNANGGHSAPAEQTVVRDRLMKEPKVPVKEGYVFGGNIFFFYAFWKAVITICFNEHGAAFSKITGILRWQCRSAIAIQLNIELGGLFFDKRACSGGADFIHLKIPDQSVLYADIFWILTSYLKYRINIRNKISR